jgi:excisionase family DNA binding protein
MKSCVGESESSSAEGPSLPGDNTVVVHEIKTGDMLAYSIRTAAVVVDLSYATIYREIQRGKIRQTHFGLITRNELQRYLASGEAAYRRIKRGRRASAVQSFESVETRA